MQLNQLKITDKNLVNRYLSFGRHELSTWAFENIFIWRGIYDISWGIISGSMCIFFQDKNSCFAYLPPLSKNIKPVVVEKAFQVMDKYNKNPAVSRIENVGADSISFYKEQGYCIREKPGDYLCRRLALAQLKGNTFKSKRAACNYFLKNYKFEYLDFTLDYAHECLDLYDQWSKERKSRGTDILYNSMLIDSRKALKVLLKNYPKLNLSGKTVSINKKVKGFTFGFRLNPETFCILFEITDLSIKGLAQFMFREFCRQLKGYIYINIMDDSYLDNLKTVKLSYRPLRIIPNYIITRRYV